MAAEQTVLDPAGPQPEKPFRLHLDLVRSLRMHRRLAIAAGGAAFLILVIVGLTRKPVFEATSLIYVQPVVPRGATDVSAGNYDSVRYDSYIQQQLVTFRRPDILGHALDQLSPAVRASLSSNKDAAIGQIESGLSVERVPGSYQIAVNMEAGDQSIVAPIANAITGSYLQNGQQDELALSGQQLESLTQERQRIQGELEQDRREQAGLSGVLGVADTAGANGDPFDAQLADLRTQLAAARNAHAIAEAQLSSVNSASQSSNSLDSAADSLTRNDAELSAMRTTLGARRGTLIAEMNGLTPQNPLYKKDQTELDELTQTIDNLTTQVSHKAGQSLNKQLELQAQRTGDVQARLEADLARRTAAATADTPKLQRARDLADSIKRLQTRYDDVDNAIHGISLGQSPNFAAHVSLMATQPASPLPSRRMMLLASALPLAVFFGISAAVIRQKLDLRVFTGQDIDNVLNFSPMAVLPDSGEVGPEVAEEFLFRLVAGIDQAHRVGGATTFVFTAGSQKTQIDNVVSSVAAELERLGYRTMTLSASEALSPVELTDKINSPALRGTTELAKLDGPNGLRVRRENLIGDNLERLKEQVDFLFIIGQPIRSSSETEFVVRLGDVTVLVVESGKTVRKELRSCMSLIQRLKARGVAVVVRDLKLENADNDFIESVRFAAQHEGRKLPSQLADGMSTIDRP